jgi:NTP pyrophosphatase (non-canonical NTP hydrolase)
MNFNEYQKKATATALYPRVGNNFVYPTLGLVGEAGEVAEKVKKLIRDKQIEDPALLSQADKEALQKELGDVLWYIAQIATELKLNLADVAEMNLTKLQSRRERDTLTGNGDDR